MPLDLGQGETGPRAWSCPWPCPCFFARRHHIGRCRATLHGVVAADLHMIKATDRREMYTWCRRSRPHRPAYRHIEIGGGHIRSPDRQPALGFRVSADLRWQGRSKAITRFSGGQLDIANSAISLAFFVRRVKAKITPLARVSISSGWLRGFSHYQFAPYSILPWFLI